MCSCLATLSYFGPCVPILLGPHHRVDLGVWVHISSSSEDCATGKDFRLLHARGPRHMLSLLELPGFSRASRSAAIKAQISAGMSVLRRIPRLFLKLSTPVASQRTCRWNQNSPFSEPSAPHVEGLSQRPSLRDSGRPRRPPTPMAKIRSLTSMDDPTSHDTLRKLKHEHNLNLTRRYTRTADTQSSQVHTHTGIQCDRTCRSDAHRLDATPTLSAGFATDARWKADARIPHAGTRTRRLLPGAGSLRWTLVGGPALDPV